MKPSNPDTSWIEIRRVCAGIAPRLMWRVREHPSLNHTVNSVQHVMNVIDVRIHDIDAI